MSNTYEVAMRRNPRNGRSTQFVLENGVAIASTSGRGYNFTVRYFSDRAKFRFLDYCDSLSACEVIEALGGAV